MKRNVKAAYIVQTQKRRESVKRTLASERAKIKIPYKPEHIDREKLREAIAHLA